MWVYRGYLSESVDEVIDLYKQKTGHKPTVLITRTETEIVGNHPNLIRSNKYGVFGLILATHLLTQKEITAIKNDQPLSFHPMQQSLGEVDLETHNPIVKMPAPGRPKKGGNKCPHCQQVIKDFNKLGWWWGWEKGIEPPYWEDLRLYVFQRDGFHCTKCDRLFGMSGLQCHHIVPKEDGGADSARNLTTLCKDCHMDSKPIMPE